MNIFSLKDILKGDKIIWIVYLFLCTVSLIEVFSADSRLTFKSNDLWAPITKHSILLFGGILVAWIVNPIATNEPPINKGSEVYVSCETAGFHKPQTGIVAGYHILPQKCHLLDQANGWARVQLQDGTTCWVPSEVLK